MRTIIFFITGMFLVVCQTTVLQMLPVWLGNPDLVFILVAFIGYRFDFFRGLVLVASFGWMMDVVAGIYLGIFLIEYILVFLVLHTLTRKSPIKESAYQVPLVGVSYCLAQLVVYASLSMMMSESLPAWSWNRVGRETVILTVATIPCFIILNSLYEFFLKRRIASRIYRKKIGNRFR